MSQCIPYVTVYIVYTTYDNVCDIFRRIEVFISQGSVTPRWKALGHAIAWQFSLTSQDASLRHNDVTKVKYFVSLYLEK